ncbi:COG3832 Uncharacterized conserved protein [Fimbriimonadaceae bacterium]
MSQTSFDSFTLRILIARTPVDVFRAWTVPDEIGKWFLDAFHTKDGEVQPQDVVAEVGWNYEWTWLEGTREEGEFTNIVANEEVAFTFGPDCAVRVRFSEELTRTCVEVVQTQSHEDETKRAEWAFGCVQGWTFYLTNLKSVLENGTDLRETQFLVPKIVNI